MTYFGWCVRCGPALCLLLAACDPPRSTGGELGNGLFVYECIDRSDLWCRYDEDDFPARVAVGARFRVTFKPNETKTRSRVRSASQVTISGSQSTLTMARPGSYGLFAEAENGRVIDVIHQRGARIDQVAVDIDDADRWKLEMIVGETLSVEARPLDADGELLAGTLRYRWRSTDESVFRVEGTGVGVATKLEARGPGKAELVVAVGDQEFSHYVRVSLEGMPTDAQAPEAGLPTDDDDAGLDDDAGAEP